MSPLRLNFGPKMFIKTLLVILLVTTAALAVKKSYDGYKVYKVVPNTEDEVAILMDVQKIGVGEFWEEHFGVKHSVKIMVSRDKQNVFLDRMIQAGIETEVVIEDLQKVIDDQLKPAKRNGRTNVEFLSMSWNRYHSLAEINTWLDELVAAYPNIVTSVTMGQSYENRDIKGIKINYNPNRNVTRIGMLEGAVHAREWISPATITWIIKEFLTSTNPEVRALAENLEWHIFPVTNPDGYSFTFTDNRMWRKNRNPNYAVICPEGVDNAMSHGVDLNRNFDFVWMSIGASNDSCTNTFAGPSAFSEPETRAISQYVLSLKDQGEFIYYLAFHSYTQIVIIPYSHITDSNDVLQAGNYADMYEIAIRGAEKLKERFGTTYRAGIAADVLYPMSGSSFDWVKYEADVPVSYLIELRDMGEFGFLLAPEQIIPNNLEVMDFILEMDRVTRDKGYYYSGATSTYSSLFVVLFGVVAVFLE